MWPVVTAMRQWGDRWKAPGGPPVELVHQGCGHVASMVPTCSACGEPVTARDVRAVAGPGGTDDPLIPRRGRRPRAAVSERARP